MTKPIPDKAEIALEYPDKLYVGTFELASTVGRIPKDDILHHDQLAQAVAELHRALVGPAKR